MKTRRLTGYAAVITAAVASLSLFSAPSAMAVGEHSKCSVNWSPNGTSTIKKNGWNLRSGPSTGYASRGYLYRGDKGKVLCSRGSWIYTELSQRSDSGLPKGTRGWVRSDGFYQLA